MRPSAIRQFDICYLASVALSAAAFLIGYDTNVALVRAETAQAGVELGGGVLWGGLLLWIAINLLLWFLVARKRLNFVKWIIAIFTALGLVGLPGLVRSGLTFAEIVSLGSIVLQIVAVWFLFQPAATAWLQSEPVASDTFE